VEGFSLRWEWDFALAWTVPLEEGFSIGRESRAMGSVDFQVFCCCLCEAFNRQHTQISSTNRLPQCSFVPFQCHVSSTTIKIAGSRAVALWCKTLTR